MKIILIIASLMIVIVVSYGWYAAKPAHDSLGAAPQPSKPYNILDYTKTKP